MTNKSHGILLNFARHWRMGTASFAPGVTWRSITRPGGLLTILLALCAESASGQSILFDALHAKTGEYTTPRGEKIVATTEENYCREMETAVAAKDEFGVKEMMDAAKIVVLGESQELPVIELDTAIVWSTWDSMKRILDMRIDVWRHCEGLNSRRARYGIRAAPCPEVDADKELVKAYKALQPNRSPQEFMDEMTFAKIRILSGDGTGKAVWTRLKFLKLPTQVKRPETVVP